MTSFSFQFAFHVSPGMADVATVRKQFFKLQT